MAERRRFKVIFHNQGKVYEIFAKQVSQGELFGFVEVEQLVFGERSSLVVDPSEESLKLEFSEVRRVFIPMHAIVRIDEVEREGVSRIREAGTGEGTLTPFPSAIYKQPKNDPGKS